MKRSEFVAPLILFYAFTTTVPVVNALVVLRSPSPGIEWHWTMLIKSFAWQIAFWAGYLWFCSLLIRNNLKSVSALVGFVYLSLSLMINQILLYTEIYKYAGVFPSGSESKITDPWLCFYYSVVTWTTLGYGDIVPGSNARMVAAVEALSGYIYMGLFIGLLSSFVFSLPKQSPAS